MDKVLLAIGSVSMFFCGHAFSTEEFFFSGCFLLLAVWVFVEGIKNS